MSKYIALLLVLIVVVSCKQDKELPKVRYEANKEKTVTKIDTTQIDIADLPIHFEGTSFLIHPIGDVNRVNRNARTAYDASSSDSEQSFTVSNNNDFQITGFLSNLKFQQVSSDSIKSLSDKPMLIETATYLKAFSDRNKQQIMVYTLCDSDTNKDGKLDGNDIQSLYLSDISGNNFVKLSPDLNELIDWNVVEANGKLYFRTIEDSNKNGAFDKNDIVHYHVVNLLSKEWKASDYSPVK